jgi:hypothetical protein
MQTIFVHQFTEVLLFQEMKVKDYSCEVQTQNTQIKNISNT